jgi:hypothetical protein
MVVLVWRALDQRCSSLLTRVFLIVAIFFCLIGMPSFPDGNYIINSGRLQNCRYTNGL